MQRQARKLQTSDMWTNFDLQTRFKDYKWHTSSQDVNNNTKHAGGGRQNYRLALNDPPNPGSAGMLRMLDCLNKLLVLLIASDCHHFVRESRIFESSEH